MTKTTHIDIDALMKSHSDLLEVVRHMHAQYFLENGCFWPASQQAIINAEKIYKK